jgi:uncharacterized lipoprotein
MKKLISLIVIFVIVGSLSSCNSNSKAKTWDEKQQKKWKKDCIELLTDNGVEKPDAEDFCDCMYKKTSEKFTPEEAENITTEQERAIWNECDYSW